MIALNNIVSLKNVVSLQDIVSENANHTISF